MEARLFHTFGAPVENAQSPSVFFVMIEGATSTKTIPSLDRRLKREYSLTIKRLLRYCGAKA